MSLISLLNKAYYLGLDIIRSLEDLIKSEISFLVKLILINGETLPNQTYSLTKGSADSRPVASDQLEPGANPARSRPAE